LPADVRHSVCALDCPDACALLINVEDGKGTRLRGDPEHPVTRGFLCGKVARYLEREYSPERLLYPLRRTGAKGEGQFARITWDEALDEIAARFQAIAADSGPEAILPYSYGGSMGYLQGSGMDRRFFHRLGASRLDRTICSAAGGVGLADSTGFKYGTEPEQFRHSRLILAWGANILGTNVHLWPFIVEARRQGASLYTIDPHRNRTGELADKHFFINPGSDTALALGMMHVIIGENLHDADYVARYTSGFDALRERVKQYPPERVAALTGIAKDEIIQLAREYATVRPAVIRLNYGLQRSERRHGGACYFAAARIHRLVEGIGGGSALSTGAFQINRAALERPDLQLASRSAAKRASSTWCTSGRPQRTEWPPIKALSS
jgi:anaerobic selenocysteine-containing dehydrogenase